MDAFRSRSCPHRARHTRRKRHQRSTEWIEMNDHSDILRRRDCCWGRRSVWAMPAIFIDRVKHHSIVCNSIHNMLSNELSTLLSSAPWKLNLPTGYYRTPSLPYLSLQSPCMEDILPYGTSPCTSAFRIRAPYRTLTRTGKWITVGIVVIERRSWTRVWVMLQILIDCVKHHSFWCNL